MYLNLILLVLALVVLLPVAIAWKNFAPWVPTREADLVRIFSLADLRPGQVFYDIGSGTGKLVFYASKNFHAESVGLELAFPFYFYSKILQVFSGQPQVVFKWKDLYKENLNRADVVYVFGTVDTLNENFQNKLEKEIKPGGKVISYAFKIGNLNPKEISKPNEKDLPIYVYQF